MDGRKTAKIAALAVGIAAVPLSFQHPVDWNAVGIYAGCHWYGRLAYPFFHANILHCVLNLWCMLSVVFIYDIGIWRMILAYLFAVTAPVDALDALLSFDNPTIGLSGVVYVLFGSISFEVLRKWYYQSWMLFYIAIGFLFPNTNAWLHLYCYLCGFVVALFNKPVEIKR